MVSVAAHDAAGIPVIGLCTDSNAMLPPEFVERFGVEVVPLTVTIDDVDHLEGVDLSPDAFYAVYDGGHRPRVRAAAPSAGQFAVAYAALIARGCTEILSIHVCSQASATVQSARLAARSLALPVKVVDTATAGFGVGCCVWQAATAISAGATLEEAATIAERLAPSIGNVFVIDSPDRDPSAGIDLLTWRPGAIDTLTRVASVLDAVNMMADLAISWGDHLRVGVGHSNEASAGIADALYSAVSESANVVEVVRFRIGASIGAFSGPGGVGCFMFPSR